MWEYEFKGLSLKGKDVTQKVKEKFFFPVEKLPLYWEKVNIHGVKELTPTWPKFYAIVDTERNWVFSTVTSSYQLVSNKQAYEFGIEISKNLFHIENEEDLKCVYAYLSPNRGICRINLCRFADYFQPLMNEGWYWYMSIDNSYNKTKCLEYKLGFYNWDYQYGFHLYGLGIKAKESHNYTWDSIKKSIYKNIDDKKFNVDWIEQSFYNKIKILKGISINEEYVLPMFCKVFGYTYEIFEKDPNNQLWNYIKTNVDKSTKEKFAKYGNNAYALLNIFAQYQYQNYSSTIISSLRGTSKYLGTWADELMEAYKKEKFNIENFISKDAMNAAKWLRYRFERK